MPKANERDIYEVRPWLNDDVQNREGLKKIVNGGGSNITVEAVTFTENGTFTAPSGKAYSPVTVNVAGGSSDFSTAAVTVIGASSIEEVVVYGAFFEEAEPPFVPEARSYGITYFYPEETVNRSVILYKGNANLIYSGTTTAVATGNISIENDNITVTGDGTITFS